MGSTNHGPARGFATPPVPTGAILVENFWGPGPWKVSTVERQKIQLHNQGPYAEENSEGFTEVIETRGVEEGRNWEGCPFPNQIVGLGKRRELPRP